MLVLSHINLLHIDVYTYAKNMANVVYLISSAWENA